MTGALIKIILDFEEQLNEIIFDEMIHGSTSDTEQAAYQMKEYLKEIKGLVNDEKEIEIRQKL